VARGVDQVHLVGLAVGGRVGHPNGGGLDRDATLTLEIHAVQVLLPHVPVRDGLGELQQAVGERALAVIDVCDDGDGTLMG
jgi:hypothetical protein